MVETTGTSSFIPKNANKVRKPRTSKRIYIFSYISYVFFFGTLLSVVGVYIYSAQVKRTLDDQKLLLADQREAFSEADINKVRDLEKRLLLTNRFVNESSAPSKIFNSIESVVVDTVRLTSFTYERASDDSFKLTFEAATETFDSAMFQRDIMQSVPELATAKVTEYTYGQEGGSQDGTGGSEPTSDEEKLIVTFETIAPTSLFPYEPPEEIVATSTLDSGSVNEEDSE